MNDMQEGDWGLYCIGPFPYYNVGELVPSEVSYYKYGFNPSIMPSYIDSMIEGEWGFYYVGKSDPSKLESGEFSVISYYKFDSNQLIIPSAVIIVSIACFVFS